MKGKRISIVTYEGDRWQGELLQRKLLQTLKQQGVAVASVLPGMAGYSKSMGITTRSLVDGGGRLPIVVEFVASQEEVDLILPIISPMVGARPITATEVEIETSASL